MVRDRAFLRKFAKEDKKNNCNIKYYKQDCYNKIQTN